MTSTLRFVICGSVDNGKSTLVGRLLWEAGQVFDDQLSALQKDSARYGTQAGSLDLALLLDGLQAEREQSITIDVAYRHFATQKRRFLIADVPGHEQYTRNMATGASTADVAVLVINASKGLQTQSLRHARILTMLGIRHVLLAINKMDLVDWDENVFSESVSKFRNAASSFGFESIEPIPVSALYGDNVTTTSSAAAWYKGPSLLGCLEEIDYAPKESQLPFRMPVQWVNRAKGEFRGYCGRIACGEVRVGDRISVLPSMKDATVQSISVGFDQRHSASTGESIMICVDRNSDISRGDIISAASHPVDAGDQFEARVLCLSEQPIVAGRSYLFNLHTCQALATISAIKYQIDVNSGTHLAACSLSQNDFGVISFSLDRRVPFDAYEHCRQLGSFLLIDRQDHSTLGAGMIHFGVHRVENLHWHKMDVDKEARARQKLQKPACLWFTGLPASGKSTIANILEKRLFAAGRHTYLLDGDNIRLGLNKDLGFSEADRSENIRRISEVARLLVDAGLVVMVSFISLFRAERDFARALFEPREFLEIFVDAPLEECQRRDPKGLFAKARRGELKDLTGIDSRYEPPGSPEVHLDTTVESAEQCADRILLALEGMLLGEPDQLDQASDQDI